MLDPTSSVGISTVYVEDAASPTVPGVSAGPGWASRSTVQVEVAAGLTVFHNRLSGGRRGSDCLSQPSKWRSPRGRLSLTTVQVEVAAGPAVSHNRPSGGRRGACRAWPGFETTRRAEGSRRGRRAGGQAPRRPKLTQLAGSEGPPSTDEQHTFARHAQQNVNACLRTGSRVP